MNNALPLDTLLTRFNLSTHAIGTARWWNNLAKNESPFIKTEQDGTCSVLFLWRDPEGNEAASSTSSVILNVSALTNHNTWQPSCLSRYGQSDVWFGSLTINQQWRGSYSFIPIKADQSPAVVQQQTDGSRNAQRRWWLDVVKQQQVDPLNNRPSVASGWGLSSALHLPNAPKELGWHEWEKGKLLPLSNADYSSFTWFAEQLNNQRQCALFSTAKGTAPLVILLDGQKWDSDSGTLSVIQYLTNINQLAPAHYLLVPCVDAKTRWLELSCYQPFWESLTEELLPQVKQMLASSGKSTGEYIVAGQSLGGLSAVYAGLYFPDYFNKVISLSGSFWWPEIERMQDPEVFKLNNADWDKILPTDSLGDRVSNGKVTIDHLHIYQTVGYAEKQLCVYNELHYEAFKCKGADIHFHKIHGGHDWLSWRSSLINGLLHFLPV